VRGGSGFLQAVTECDHRIGRALRRATFERYTPTTLMSVAVLAGIVAILRRSIIFGIVLIIAGFLVGPGGVSIFK